LVALGLLIVIPGLFYVTLYRPQRQTLKQRQQDIEEAKQEIRAQRPTLKERRQVEATYSQLREMLGYSDNVLYQKNFLANPAAVDLMVRLNQAALAAEVDLIMLKRNAVKSSGAIYSQLPVQVSLTGSYDQLVNYINEIKDFSYLTRIEELTINSGLTPQEEITVDMNLTAYLLTSSVSGEGDTE
jgi:Tfp pilus assembly protein PilO